MFSGESSCPGDSEYVWQRGVEGILGRVTGSPSLPHFPKNKRILAVKKKSHSHNNQNWALKHKSLLAIDYGKTWFKFVSSNLKIVLVVLFFTAHIFANGPHFVALSKLRAAKTRSNKFFSLFFSECWVRKDFLGVCPKKFSHFWVRSDLRKSSVFCFSLIYLSIPPKKVFGSCTHNFDATDLPNS